MSGHPKCKASDLKVGDTREQVLVENLTRTQIVMYAGASGDFNPIHHDETFATKVAGYASVFAHGMLSMGMTGRLVTDWLGDGVLTEYGVRFVKQVWPGDTLTAKGTVTAVGADGTVEVEVTTTNQNGEPVVAGPRQGRAAAMSTMRERVAELAVRRAKASEMGGAERVAKQHARGKLTARERIALLFDPGAAFDELAILGKQPGVDSPADAVVCGFGKVAGRPVGVAAYDFTVLGGSMGPTGEAKAARMRELCLRHRMPMVWLVDSGGARIGGGGLGGGGAADEEYGASVFAETGALFREQIVMSGVVPQVAAMVGPGAAGTAYIPGLADFVPMVKGTSSMALGGPYLVKAAVGEDVTEEDLGGSKVHCEISGVGDLEVADDPACMEAIRTYLSFMPSHCEEMPPVVPCDDPIERADEALLDLVPDNPRRAYDMRKLVAHLADHGRVFEIKPKWAKNLVTAFIRLGGRPVGVVANNPMYLGGTLDVDSADKAAKFVQICDAFGVPLCFLQDTPGFVIGSKVERAGIIRHGAKMLHYVASATVPKICVLVRKAYGAGYYAMNGRAYEPDWIVAWPTAEIAVMGPEGMVSIFAQKKLREIADDAERRAFIEQAASRLRAGINPYVAGIRAMVDDVIDPRETRAVVARALARFATKRVERPWRKRGIVPV